MLESGSMRAVIIILYTPRNTVRHFLSRGAKFGFPPACLVLSSISRHSVDYTPIIYLRVNRYVYIYMFFDICLVFTKFNDTWFLISDTLNSKNYVSYEYIYIYKIIKPFYIQT